jgi:LDH2 family malate/lactate/ureidoglycolate dehydrogenase
MPRRPMSVLRETEISTLYDGGNNNGMLTLHHAAKAAIAKAAARGFALIGLTNSWMSGRSAHFVEMIARADLVAIHTASASRAVAPFGGTRPALGTNPIAFALPTARGPLVFDMGTAAFMMTELMLRERRRETLPQGVALDAAGQPTTDPASARQGALLPFGGYKGFGLALMVQALGVLAGSSLDIEGDNGYLFIVFKPDLLTPLDQFKREMSELIDRIKATPRQAGVAEIRIPSERAFRHRERALVEGIEIDRAVHEALKRMAG